MPGQISIGDLGQNYIGGNTVDPYGALAVPTASAMPEAATHAMSETGAEAGAKFPNPTIGGVAVIAIIMRPITLSRRNAPIGLVIDGTSRTRILLIIG